MTARDLALGTGIPLALIERAEVGTPVAAVDLVILLHAVGTTLETETERITGPQGGRSAWSLDRDPGMRAPE